MKAWTSDFSATPIPLMRCRLYGEVSRVEPHNGHPALFGFFDLVVGEKTSHQPQRYGSYSKDPLDAVLARFPARVHVNHADDLAQAHRRMFRLEVYDQPSYARRQFLAFGCVRIEEAFYPFDLEAVHPAVERPLGGAGLLGALGHGATEQHKRTDLFVAYLFGPLQEQLEPLPVVGRLDASMFSLSHLPPPSLPSLWEGKHAMYGDLPPAPIAEIRAASSANPSARWRQRFSGEVCPYTGNLFVR